MQLLKLTQTYNTTYKQGFLKQNPKNYYLNILQKCIHVPKDDRLILRKYLSSLKQISQDNEIIFILSKYSIKKGKENVDKKLEVLLRKLADKLRKQEQWHLVANKVDEGLQKINQKKVVIDPKRYCNNFELMKRSIKNQSVSKSRNNSHVGSVHHSNSKVSKLSTQKKALKQFQFKSRLSQKFQPFQSLGPSSRETRRNNYNFTYRKPSNCRQVFSSTQQLRRNSSKSQSNRGLKACRNLSQNFNNLNIKPKDQFAKPLELNQYPNETIYKHRHTKSRSLGSIILNYNQNNHQRQQLVERDTFKEDSSSRGNARQEGSQQYTSIPPIQGIQSSSITMNLSMSNFNSFNSHTSNIASLFSTMQFATKSIHSELKDLKICAEDFHDFIIPMENKQSRSPSDLSLPYKDFIDKLNCYVGRYYGSNATSTFTCQSLFIPFQTQYDLVTFEKLVQFIEQYAYPKFHNNGVRDLYTRIEIGLCGISQMVFNHKRITIQEFKKAYQWKRPVVRTKFQQLVKRCNRWGTCITYWQLYWLKDSVEFQQFQKQFSID